MYLGNQSIMSALSPRQASAPPQVEDASPRFARYASSLQMLCHLSKFGISAPLSRQPLTPPRVMTLPASDSSPRFALATRCYKCALCHLGKFGISAPLSRQASARENAPLRRLLVRPTLL
jgi:hypothetical protein